MCYQNVQKNRGYSIRAKKDRFWLILPLLLLIGSHSMASAQTSTPSPTPTPAPLPDSDEVKRLKEEKAQSELRKSIAENEKAELEAKFPKPKSSPLEGKTDVDSGVKLESEMLAYRSMSDAADKIVTDLKVI